MPGFNSLGLSSLADQVRCDVGRRRHLQGHAISLLRLAPLVIVLVLSALWLASIWPLVQAAQGIDGAFDPSQQLPLGLQQPLDWRDAIVLRLSIDDVAVQQERGGLSWQAGNRIGRMPVTVVADGQPHIIVVPVGTQPEWSGATRGMGGTGGVRNVRLTFPGQADLQLHLTRVELVKRSSFATDAALGRLLATALPVWPEGQSFMLATGMIFIAAMTIVAPLTWRARIASTGTSLICALLATATVITQLGLFGPIWSMYSALTESAAKQRVAHYAAPAQMSTLLIQADTRLPAGPVFVEGQSQTDRFVYARAHDLLWPRVVRFDETGPAAPATLIGSTGLVRPARPTPLTPGWERIAGPLGGWEVLARRTATQAAPKTAPKTAPKLDLTPPSSADWTAWPRWALSLALVVVTGTVLARNLGWRGIEAFACGLPFGAAVLTVGMTALSMVSVRWTVFSAGGALVACATMLVIVACRRLSGRKQAPGCMASPAPPTGGHAPHDLAAILVAVSLGTLFIVCVIQAGLTPFADQDAWTTWGYNARAYFGAGDLVTAVTHIARSTFSHPSYPPLLPLLQAWSDLAMGGVSERLTKAAMPAWYLSLTGLVYAEARRHLHLRAASLLALFVATTPILLDHAMLNNADLPFTVMLVIGGMALARWLSDGQTRWLASAVLALAASAWTKLDGVYLGLALLSVAAIVKVITLARRSDHQHNGATVVHFCIAAGAFIVACLPWPLLIHSLGLSTEAPSISALSVYGLQNLWRGILVTLSEAAFSHTNSTWSLLGSGFGVLWFVCIGVLIWRWRHWGRDGVAVFWASGALVIILFYIVIYALRPFFSIERYMLHAAPLAIFASVRAASLRSSPGQHDGHPELS